MSIEDKFGFIGWNTEGTSDKVWGYFYRPQTETSEYRWNNPNHGRNVCIFWARRGNTMRFKADVAGYELDDLRDSKLKKGYVKIDQSKLLAIWPTFVAEAEAKLMWEVLAGKVK